MLESTITAKGQTTLPKDVRERLGLRPGDKLRYLISGDEVRILKPRKVMSLKGLIKYDGSAVTLDAMDEAIRAGASGEISEE